MRKAQQTLGSQKGSWRTGMDAQESITMDRVGEPRAAK